MPSSQTSPQYPPHSSRMQHRDRGRYQQVGATDILSWLVHHRLFNPKYLVVLGLSWIMLGVTLFSFTWKEWDGNLPDFIHSTLGLPDPYRNTTNMPRPERGNFIYEYTYQKALWRWVAGRLPQNYNAFNFGVDPGTRGIVYTSSSGWVNQMILSVIMLRDTGCTLPIQFMYIEEQINQEELQKIRYFNITTIDFTVLVKDHDWNHQQLALGGPKVDSMLGSSFEQLLFLDPDVVPLRDPTYLFETKLFKKYGALFWGDTMNRWMGSTMWWLLNIVHKQMDELEFESGQMVLDKRKAWKGLLLARHMVSHGKYYFKHFWGDKETFHWAFQALDIPYFLNPAYLSIVGSVADNTTHRKGGATLDYHSSNNSYTLPPNTTFCGLSMLQKDFLDTDSEDPVEAQLGYNAKPLFMHANGVKYSYHEDEELGPFHAAITYDVPQGKFAHQFAGIHHDWIGEYGQLQHCVGLLPAKKMNKTLEVWESKYHPGLAKKYRAAHKLAFASLSDIKQLWDGKTKIVLE